MPVTFHCIPVGIDNCYLLRGEKTILIDGGAPYSAKNFEQGLQKLGINPREIELIILTHGHLDHIGSLQRIKELTGAKLAVHHADQGWVENGNPPFPPGVTPYGRGMIWLAERLLHLRFPPVKVDIVIGDEGLSLAEYGIPGQVIHTPGHSPGSVSILLSSGDAFVGDWAMNSWFLRLTPGLPIFAANLGQVLASWQNLFALGAKMVYPAHGNAFPIAVMQREVAAYLSQ